MLNLEPFMLTKNNLNKYYFLSEESFKNLNYKPDKVKVNNKKILNENNFTIDKEDKLFWSFYIFLYGYDEYYLIKNFFITEKNIKINNIIKIRENKDLLKSHKIVKSFIENELANEKKISIITLNALALIYKLNILYIKNRFIYVMNYSDVPLKECKNIIEEKKDKEIYLINLEPEIIDQVLNNYYIIDNINKPFNAISYYKIQDLINIAKKLNLDSQNKKKVDLYTEINNLLI
jgi:hypothetical protein